MLAESQTTCYLTCTMHSQAPQPVVLEESKMGLLKWGMKWGKEILPTITMLSRDKALRCGLGKIDTVHPPHTLSSHKSEIKP